MLFIKILGKILEVKLKSENDLFLTILVEDFFLFTHFFFNLYTCIDI